MRHLSHVHTSKPIPLPSAQQPPSNSAAHLHMLLRLTRPEDSSDSLLALLPGAGVTGTGRCSLGTRERRRAAGVAAGLCGANWGESGQLHNNSPAGVACWSKRLEPPGRRGAVCVC